MYSEAFANQLFIALKFSNSSYSLHQLAADNIVSEISRRFDKELCFIYILNHLSLA